MLEQINPNATILHKLTVGVAANRKLDIVWHLHLDHRRLIVDDLLNGKEDLVDEFLVDLLAVLKPLDHVVDELLRHLIFNLYTIVVWFDGDRVKVETFGRRRLIANFDSSIKVELAHNLLALGKLNLGIFVVGIQSRAFLEVLQGILGFQDGSIGDGAAEISLGGMHIRNVDVATVSSLNHTFTSFGLSSIALVASAMA